MCVERYYLFYVCFRDLSAYVVLTLVVLVKISIVCSNYVELSLFEFLLSAQLFHRSSMGMCLGVSMPLLLMKNFF